MADNTEHVAHESFMDKIAEKLHFHHDTKEDGHQHEQHKVEAEKEKVLEKEKQKEKEKENEKEKEKQKEKEKEKEKEKIKEDSSSSSSSDDESEKFKPVSSPSVAAPVAAEKVKPVSSPSVAAPVAASAKVSRLFGRQKPVYEVLGGGKPAEVFLWRNKKISASVLGTATVIWILFELLEYHLLTLVCHVLIFGLAVLFLWANATNFINKSPPQFPEFSVPEQPFLQVAAALRFELNRAFALVHDIAIGKDLKKFLAVIAGLWLLSIVGKSFDFLTLFYINFVLLHTVPVLYEKHEDKVDAFAERAFGEAKKHYGVVNERYISKIPMGPLKSKKSD